MDGTPSGYYYRAGGTGDSESTTWVMHVHGGGACGDYDACVDWKNKDTGSMGVKGSSAGWDEEKNGSPGALEPNPEKNPVFHNAHHIWVPYCTGDGHGGQVSELAGPVGELTDEVNAPWGNWYFSGHLNMKAMFRHINSTKPAWAKMEKFLFQGNSAGGIGVFTNCDWVAKFVKHTVGAHAQVKCNPSAGWFVPAHTEDNPDKTAAPTPYELWSQGQLPPAMSDVDPQAPIKPFYPENCLKHLNGRPAHMCASATWIYPTIQQPVYVVNDIYDFAQIQGVFGLPSKQVGTCQANEYISYFGKAMVNTITELMSKKPEDGVFLPSCYNHGVELTATIQGFNEVDGLSAWWTGDGSAPTTLIEDCHKASDTWLPCGQGCTTIPQCTE